MDLWKKIVIGYYLLIVSFTLGLVSIGGSKFDDSSFQRIITVFSIAIVPVALSAIRTSDFWRDDPNSVSNATRIHAEEMARVKQAHEKEKSESEEMYAEQMSYAETISSKTIADQKQKIADMTAAHAAEIKKERDDYLTKLAQAARAAKQVPRCDPTLLG